MSSIGPKRKATKKRKRRKYTAEDTSMELRKSMADLIVKRLKQLDCTQRKLAEACGLSEVYLSRIVNCRANVRVETAAKILWSLGIRACIKPSPAR